MVRNACGAIVFLDYGRGNALTEEFSGFPAAPVNAPPRDDGNAVNLSRHTIGLLELVTWMLSQTNLLGSGFWHGELYKFVIHAGTTRTLMLNLTALGTKVAPWQRD